MAAFMAWAKPVQNRHVFARAKRHQKTRDTFFFSKTLDTGRFASDAPSSQEALCRGQEDISAHITQTPQHTPQPATRRTFFNTRAFFWTKQVRKFPESNNSTFSPQQWHMSKRQKSMSIAFWVECVNWAACRLWMERLFCTTAHKVSSYTTGKVTQTVNNARNQL